MAISREESEPTKDCSEGELAPEIAELDCAAVSADLLRALRGRRSQAGFSRWLGYSSSVAHRWETGQAWLTTTRFFQVCDQLGLDVAQCFERFLGDRPAWLDNFTPCSRQAAAAFLRQVRGKTPISRLAKATAINRYSISRWLKGEADPKLPEFFCLVEASSRRLLDFVAALVDPARLPSVALRWKQLQQARQAAYDEPWSHAVLRALETESYRRSQGEIRVVAECVGTDDETVARALAVLTQLGQVKKHQGKWCPTRVVTVNTNRDQARARELRAYWSRLAADRAEAGHPGHYGYSLFAISREDLRVLHSLHIEYVRAMQDIIAHSKRSECVALYASQLLDLSGGTTNTFSKPHETSTKRASPYAKPSPDRKR